MLYNVSSAAASAYAIALHALLLAPVIVLGFALLWSMHFSFRQIMGLSENAQPVPAPGALK